MIIEKRVDDILRQQSFINSIIMKSYPESIAIKSRMEGKILIVMTEELSLEFMNEVAADFFYKIDGKKNLALIISDLCKEYDADFDAVANDIIELTRDLQRKRVVRLNNQSI